MPYAFEKRILARVTTRVMANLWELWGTALWRAAAPCVAVLFLAGIWTLLVNDFRGSPDPLSVALEDTVRAPLDNLDDSP